MPITRSILQTAVQHPDRLAIAGEDKRLTYSELVEDGRRVIATARHLLTQAPNPPEPAPETKGTPVVAVSSTSAIDAARIMAGLAGYRAVSATIDPRWPVAHQGRVIVGAGIGVVIVENDQAEAALVSALGSDWGGVVVTLRRFCELEAQVAPAEPPAVRDADEPFLMLFSSGTTSAPKAFLKTRGQYRANFAVSSQYLEPDPSVRTLAPGPFAYSLTLYAAVECLASGGSAHLADSFTLAGLGGRIAAEGITRIVTVPAVVRGIIAQAGRTPEDFAGLELIVVGGANLPATMREDLGRVLPGVRLISYYGAAEIGFIGDSHGGDGTWNQIYDGVQVEIRDDAGAVVPVGEIGTVWVLADARSDGYIAATSDAQLLDNRGWATVEDQGRVALVAGKAQLQLVGRKGDIINTGGHKVALPEVTAAYQGLATEGEIVEVVALGLPDPTLGAVVALAVEVGDRLGADAVGSAVLTKAELRAIGRKNLAPQFVPAQYYLVRSLPRTVGGKVRSAEAVQMLIRAGASAAAAQREGVVRL